MKNNSFFDVMPLRQGASMMSVIACILITHLGDQLAPFSFKQIHLAAKCTTFKNISQKKYNI
jgi:hypothetical protein